MLTHTEFEAIARYETGDMDAEERAGFEARLLTESGLQQQLQLYREVDKSLRSSVGNSVQEQQLRDTLRAAGAGYFKDNAATDAGGIQATPGAVRTFTLRRYLKPAMGVAAAVIALFIWRPWQPDMYTRYSHITMTGSVERGEGSDTLLQRATTAFNQKQYHEATGLLQQLLQRQTDNSFIRFYYGVALLETDQVAEARTELNLLYNGSSAFKYEAAYYMALSFVKENKNTEAQKWLRYIPQDAAVYERASELLKKL